MFQELLGFWHVVTGSKIMDPGPLPLNSEQEIDKPRSQLLDSGLLAWGLGSWKLDRVSSLVKLASWEPGCYIKLARGGNGQTGD